MKKYLGWIIAALLLVATVYFVYAYISASRVYDQVSVLKGIVNEKDLAIEKNKEELAEYRRAHEERIAELNGAIDSANTVIADLEVKVGVKTKKIGELEDGYSELPSLEEKNKNLSTQVKLWKEKFSLVKQQLDEERDKYFSLSEKYDAALKLNQRLEEALTLCRQDIDAKAALIKGLEKKAKRRDFFSKIERGIGLTAITALACLVLVPQGD